MCFDGILEMEDGRLIQRRHREHEQGVEALTATAEEPPQHEA